MQKEQTALAHENHAGVNKDHKEVDMAVKAEDVKAAARGHWLWVLPAVAPALEAACARPGRHVPSPVRGGKDGFRLYKDAALTGRGVDNQEGSFGDGFALLQWVTGLGFHDVLLKVNDLLGGSSVTPVELPKPQLTVVKNTGDVKKLHSLWARGKTAGQATVNGGHPAKAYLEGRGIPYSVVSEQSELRLADSLMTKEGEVLHKLPGILARVVDVNGELVTLHRTFLSLDGKKAPLESPKKIMPVAQDQHLAGSAVRLGGNPIEGFLGVAEGIETALSVITATGLPCWSVVNSFGMETFEPPKGVNTVIVFGDKDSADPVTGKRPGQDSANHLKERLEKTGVRVLRVFPKEPIPEGSKGVDWNDVLVHRGVFPTFAQIKAVC